MCEVLRVASVPKNTIMTPIHTTAIRIEIGHSSSAYSFVVVKPMGKLITAATITNCHPQKVKAANLSENNRVAGFLYDIVSGSEQSAGAKSEDHCVCMQWA